MSDQPMSDAPTGQLRNDEGSDLPFRCVSPELADYLIGIGIEHQKTHISLLYLSSTNRTCVNLHISVHKKKRKWM